jgi:hypothetical protein
VVQTCQGAGFDAELFGDLFQILARGRAFGQPGQHLFDSADPSGQTQVVGTIDGPHASLSDQLLDGVPPAQHFASF